MENYSVAHANILLSKGRLAYLAKGEDEFLFLADFNEETWPDRCL
jgi:hypothetical protein